MLAPPNVTDKQQKLAEALIDPKNANVKKADLLKNIGYSHLLAEKNPQLAFSGEGLKKALANLGYSMDSLVKPVLDASTATQTSWYQGELHKSDEPDHNLRLKAVDQLADYMGLKKNYNVNQNINVNVEVDEIQGLF